MSTPSTQAASALHPALFLGHGSPMMAIEPGPFTATWERLGRTLPRPRAILSISAHWYTRGTAVTAMERPRTIHDFHGFPPALFAVQYPAPGDVALARRVRALLAPGTVHEDAGEWGLDHGTWSVLRYLYPAADIPVVQLSIDGTLPPASHYEFGRRLAPLRAEGVLVLGSGNVVHNLRAVQWGAHGVGEPRAAAFDDYVRRAVLSGDDQALVEYHRGGEAARWSVPTPDHYLPLLYVLGMRQPGEAATIACEGLDLGSISMLGVQLGAAGPGQPAAG